MSRKQLFWLAGGLALAGVACLFLGASLMPDVRDYVADHYQEYASDGDGTRYACTGTPKQVADDIANYKNPEARASDGGTEYLRYEDDIVIVGPDGSRPCTVRVEDINAGYSHGGFIFLGPGFYPGSPAGDSGGTPGGPDGSK